MSPSGVTVGVSADRRPTAAVNAPSHAPRRRPPGRMCRVRGRKPARPRWPPQVPLVCRRRKPAHALRQVQPSTCWQEQMRRGLSNRPLSPRNGHIGILTRTEQPGYLLGYDTNGFGQPQSRGSLTMRGSHRWEGWTNASHLSRYTDQRLGNRACPLTRHPHPVPCSESGPRRSRSQTRTGSSAVAVQQLDLHRGPKASIIALSRPFPSVPNDGRVQDWRGEITVPGDGCTRLRLQEAKEPSDVRIDRSAGLGGRMLTPQPVHQQADRDRQSNGAYRSDKVSTRSRQGRYSTIRARTAEGPARDVFSAGRITHGKGP